MDLCAQGHERKLSEWASDGFNQILNLTEPLYIAQYLEIGNILNIATNGITLNLLPSRWISNGHMRGFLLEFKQYIITHGFLSIKSPFLK